MKQNYQLMLDKTLAEIGKSGERPTLLLHACCAPCSSYVLEYLSKYFKITLFFYNPNISPEAEYNTRLRELERFVKDAGLAVEVDILPSKYEPERFFEIAKGFEDAPEGGERCERCFRLRLEESAIAAKNGGFDYFTTTLSISPHKNAELLAKIGEDMSKKYGVKYLYSDFKKKGGYLRSCKLSEQYGLYRQDFCGCIYSKLESERIKR